MALPVWLSTAVAVACWSTIILVSPSEAQQWAMGAGALVLSSLHLFLASWQSHLRSVAPEFLGAAALVAGMAWGFGGTMLGADHPAARDAAVLLVLGGIILTLPFVVREPGIWLSGFAASAACVVLGAFAAPDRMSASESTWAVSALTAVTGLTMIAAAFTSWAVSGRHRDVFSIGSWGSVAWGTGGMGLLAMALSLVDPDGERTAWWFPVIAGSMLWISVDQGWKTSQTPNVERLPRSINLASIAGLLTASTIATATIFWIAREVTSRLDLGIITVAVLVAVVALMSVVTSIAVQHRSFDILKSLAAQLLRQSRTDALTGLPNRRALNERLETEILRAARFNHALSVGMLDVDDFKLVNDTWGHQAGDVVLQMIARHLERELRAVDIAGRFGGEEFLLILPETDLEGAWIAADRVLRSIRAMPPLEGTVGRSITASIGLATFPSDGRDAGSLLTAADEALYSAKRAGKNQIFASVS